jgi:hypothetical protein
MRALATLAAITDQGVSKVIAISPKDDAWFVNYDDLPKEYKELADQSNSEGKCIVLGMLFVPGEEL